MKITIHRAVVMTVPIPFFFYKYLIFSTKAHVSGHQVSLAKQPRPSLHGTIMEKLLSYIFCKLFADKTFSRN